MRTVNENRMEVMKGEVDVLRKRLSTIIEMRGELYCLGFTIANEERLAAVGEAIEEKIAELNKKISALQDPEVRLPFGGCLGTSTKLVIIKQHYVFADDYRLGQIDFAHLMFVKNLRVGGKFPIGNEYVKIGCSTGTWKQVEDIWNAWQQLRADQGLERLSIPEVGITD